MIYNQDDDENFLSDRKVGEVNNNSTEYRRRGGAYHEERKDSRENRIAKVKNKEENDTGIFGIVVIIIALIVASIAVIVLFKAFKNDSNNNSNTQSNNKVVSTTVTNNSTSTNNTTTSNNNSTSNDSSKNNTSNSGISSVNDTYEAYSIDIESVVHVKGGSFYNNNEKIKGDKAYVEYKQISGLKDTKKEEKINEKLKSLSVDLYDKNYLGDKDTLFIDIHTKLSVNFNTLSYLVIKTYEDIDGNRKNEKVISYNIRLDNLEEIEFEDLFTENTNIKNLYSKYVKGEVNVFYFDPKNIYVYDNDLKEEKIDISKYYSNIAIYSKYIKDSNIFNSLSTSQKVFTMLDSTVSEETKDRSFEQN